MRPAQALRLARGLRALVAEGSRPDPVATEVHAAKLVATRASRFLENLDQMVWTVPSSPYRPLLDHAGIGAADVAALVNTRGLEAALGVLRDEGVYVAYDEWLGTTPARRGSKVFHFAPAQFFNPGLAPDYRLRTGGTRTAGIPIAVSFSSFRRVLREGRLLVSAYDLWSASSAIWLPVLPSSAGLAGIVGLNVLGTPPSRWFTPISPRVRGVALQKRLANVALPLGLRAFGVRAPPPEYVPASNPDPVLDWCLSELRMSRPVWLGGYANLLSALGQRAVERGVSLAGTTVAMLGEPVTRAKAASVRAAGAQVLNAYVFLQLGTAGLSCPRCEDEELHVLEAGLAVIDRPVKRSDGVEVPALLWTTLEAEVSNVFLNVENDDYATIERDVACDCVFGRAGYRSRISGVRGISKVVASGVTVPGEVFERLVDRVLPGRFGGVPSDYQFVESERDGRTTLALRVAPSVGPVDDDRVLATVRVELRATEPGALAAASWADSEMLTVERALPITTAAGKVLPLEVMKTS